MVNEVRNSEKGHGLNADTGEVVDLVEAGVIDPAMVTRSALQNAASIAKNILTTEAIVAEIPEKEPAGVGGGGMPGHGRNDVRRALQRVAGTAPRARPSRRALVVPGPVVASPFASPEGLPGPGVYLCRRSGKVPQTVEKNLNTPGGFDASYEELRPLAVAAAQRVLRDQAAAEDVAQDVFIALWRNPKAYDPKRGSLRSYVSLMARSRALDRWRTRQAREAAVDRSAAEQRVSHTDVESAAEPVLRRDRSRRILHALDSLPGEQREAVLLAFGRGLTAQEIASAIGVPLGTAKSRVRLGLQKARSELQAA